MKGLDSGTSFYLGFGLAVMSTFLMGVGFIFKKIALLRVATGRSRAGHGSLLYLREWKWWLGLSLFALGEGANFVAYTMAPAALVTPLGGLSVLVCAVLSARFLNERLSFTGKLGCLICMLGSLLIVLHAPKEQMVNSLVEMRSKFFDHAFLIYGAFVIVFSCLLIFVIAPRLGTTNPVFYLLISANLGSISVMACKGLGLAFQDMVTIGPRLILTYWFFWLLVGLLVSGVSVQLYYLNRALDLFNTGLVTALLYVFFTGFVLTASAILFREWVTLTSRDYVELFCGLILITVGVFMMTVLKDVTVEWRSLALLGPNSVTSGTAGARDFNCSRSKQSRRKCSHANDDDSSKLTDANDSTIYNLSKADELEREPLNRSTERLFETI